MGQGSNSNRNASLDNKKRRAAGRMDSPGAMENDRRDFDSPQPGRGQTLGAFGKEGHPRHPSRRSSNLSKGGGGGGGPATPRD